MRARTTAAIAPAPHNESRSRPQPPFVCVFLCRVQGKISLDLGLLQDGAGEDSGVKTNASAVVPCWAFATFDGHAGPACAHFLRENFMVSFPWFVRSYGGKGYICRTSNM